MGVQKLLPTINLLGFGDLIGCGVGPMLRCLALVTAIRW